MVSKNVIYARHGEGPFRGKLNGDRKYKVDMTAATSTMGTYHYLDGERVRVYYRGNTKTCGRCHQVAHQFPGESWNRKEDSSEFFLPRVYWWGVWVG